jgi:hypothetical protein
MAQVIYTYFEDLYPYSAPVLAKFLASWRNKGFTVEVLTKSHALIHPDYHGFMEKVAQYPTTNAPIYELCCYRRWLAFALQSTPCWTMDYDIYNHSLHSLPVHNHTADYFGPAMTYWHNTADINAFLHLLVSIPTWRYNEEHMSDMMIFNNSFRPPAIRNDTVLDHPGKAPLIHFSGSGGKLAMLDPSTDPAL